MLSRNNRAWGGSRGEYGHRWLGRNVCLPVVAMFVVVYCMFMVRTSLSTLMVHRHEGQDGGGDEKLAASKVNVPDDVPRSISALVSSSWLRNARETNQLTLLVLDCNDPDAFPQGHIPQAIPFTFASSLLKDQTPKATNVISKDNFRGIVKLLQIPKDATIVFYDDKKSLNAARIWWVFRHYGFPVRQLKVLDGGLKQWLADGNEMATGEPEVPDRSAELWDNVVNTHVLVGFDAVQRGIADPATQFVDARSPEEYSGKDADGNAHAGHVPGAVNFNWVDAIDADHNGQFKPKTELDTILVEKLHLDKDKPVITYCQRAIRGAHLAFTLEQVLEFKNVKIYENSMLQYLNRDDSQVETSRSYDVPMTLWLRRNIWLIAAVTLVIIYCIFMVRTTMWARAFDEQEQQKELQNEGDTMDSNAMKSALAALKEMGALKGEELQEQVEEKAEEAAEDGRGQLDQGGGEQEAEAMPFEKRHDKVAGYNATLAYLQNYTTPIDSKENLFLFFTCSNAQGAQDDWTPHCGEAREKVYAAFAKSPSTNRLVTIYAGTREDWRGGNEFTDDDDMRLKALPTVMRWDGGAPGALRSTWGVLVGQSVLYEPLLRYLFRNADEHDKKLVQPETLTKEIVTLKGYGQYRAYMEDYARSGTPYPLFMMMVSGRFQRNNRLWCPWCRQSEMPVEYAFYAYAPANAKLVLVETYDRYSEWRNPENEFKRDPQLSMKGVPWFYRIYPGPPGQPLTYQRVKHKFYLLEALQSVFEGP
ncbi:hypothetical protein BBP00_00006866 [Phytophthora kernoviae]|uniref:Rhodanese domain-containing protein n=1 Tax=Phytophthora kernoviae TaxID=325452 RepID=A0A3F2RKG4_9STRA|nr:hypothetical protein BBP00_00006866 [Phytophthora kernoviae]